MKSLLKSTLSLAVASMIMMGTVFASPKTVSCGGEGWNSADKLSCQLTNITYEIISEDDSSKRGALLEKQTKIIGDLQAEIDARFGVTTRSNPPTASCDGEGWNRADKLSCQLTNITYEIISEDDSSKRGALLEKQVKIAGELQAEIDKQYSELYPRK
jgi:6-phosphogluconate dehydrogenase